MPNTPDLTPAASSSSFPGLAGKTFLDAACVSLIPRQACDAIHAFLDSALSCPAPDASLHHVAMDAARGTAVTEAARLLSCSERNIALVESTTHGLSIAARSLPLGEGDNVLVADTEFLQVAIPWATRPGVEVRPVANHDGGRIEVEDFERVVDARTRAVCVSSVQWSSGLRVDVRRLGEMCRSRGVWLVVDAIQEMGALRIDCSEPFADFVVAGGHKWLNAPFGCGILYLSDRVLRELTPPCPGYLALETPEGGWKEYFQTPTITPYGPFDFVRGAKRFEIAGTSNYPGAIGLGASLKLLNRMGIDAVDEHVRRLSAFAAEQLRREGARVISPEDPGSRSGITVFRYFDEPDKDRALLDRLLADRIYVAMRYTAGVGGIRVSTHYFNDEEDVLALTAAVRRAVAD